MGGYLLVESGKDGKEGGHKRPVQWEEFESAEKIRHLIKTDLIFGD